MIGLFLALALGCAPKAASVAEQHRLEGELRSLAARAHWSGVDGTYRRLLALPGAPLSYDDHWLGAQAAEALGEPAEVYRRLQAAIALDATDAALDWSARILINSGAVSLRTPGGGDLVALDMPFEPDWRHTVEVAQAALRAQGAYEGLLPLGRYTLGGQPFEVVGEPLVELHLRP